jgi:Subtilisin-like serine proteases
MRKLVIVSLAVLISGVAFFTFSSGVDGKSAKFISAVKPIEGQFIVVLADNGKGLSESQSMVETQTQDLAGDYNADIDVVFSRTLKGFTARMSKADAMRLSADPRIAFVEEDSEISPSIEAQAAPDWGLDRVDQATLPLNSNFVYSNRGAGVNVYIIDSGINPSHQDFGGRAAVAHDVLNDGQNGIDCRGHGTHIAGTVGSATYGVAKSANLWGVRVLPCVGTGQLSDLMAGIEWVTANHVDPAVVNISINAAGTSPGLDTVINNSIAAGVHYVVSAGNANADACGHLPANIPGVIVTGATTSSDNRAGYSNQGPCIDVWAPGHSITSTDYLTITVREL